MVKDDGIRVIVKMVDQFINKGGEVGWKVIMCTILVLFHVPGRCLINYICQLFQIRLTFNFYVILGGSDVCVRGVSALDGGDVRIWHRRSGGQALFGAGGEGKIFVKRGKVREGRGWMWGMRIMRWITR